MPNGFVCMSHDFHDLIHLFDRCFKEPYQTVLVKGESEPIYIPRTNNHDYHQLIFAHGFYASALHEIAHWCVAGDERRLLEDFGYWYKPDGRSQEEQRVFEIVEVKPQALEWIFSMAAGCRFRVSADNLSGAVEASAEFKQRVYQQVMEYLHEGLPQRANQFLQALCSFYRQGKSVTNEMFVLESI